MKKNITGYKIEFSEINLKNINDIKELLYKYKYLSIKNFDLDADGLIDFSKKFGGIIKFKFANYRHNKHDEIIVLNNKSVENNTGVKRVGNFWHSDSSYMEYPLPLTFLHGIKIPDCKNYTYFIDMEEVLANTPKSVIETIINCYAEHKLSHRYQIEKSDVHFSLFDIVQRIEKEHPPVFHPCYFKHPFTNKEVLYLNPGYATGIFKNKKELLYDQKFIENLIFNNSSIQEYEWEENDLLIWDNRQVIHKAQDISSDIDRIMYRTGVDDGKFY